MGEGTEPSPRTSTFASQLPSLLPALKSKLTPGILLHLGGSDLHFLIWKDSSSSEIPLAMIMHTTLAATMELC